MFAIFLFRSSVRGLCICSVTFLYPTKESCFQLSKMVDAGRENWKPSGSEQRKCKEKLKQLLQDVVIASTEEPDRSVCTSKLHLGGDVASSSDSHEAGVDPDLVGGSLVQVDDPPNDGPQAPAEEDAHFDVDHGLSKELRPVDWDLEAWGDLAKECKKRAGKGPDDLRVHGPKGDCADVWSASCTRKNERGGPSTVDAAEPPKGENVEEFSSLAMGGRGNKPDASQFGRINSCVHFSGA